jgi:hypothetical protein
VNLSEKSDRSVEELNFLQLEHAKRFSCDNDNYNNNNDKLTNYKTILIITVMINLFWKNTLHLITFQTDIYYKEPGIEIQ